MDTTPPGTPPPAPSIDERIAATVKEQATGDAAGLAAGFKPLPGATFDAFAAPNNIQVGKYSIRAFCDRDFIFLDRLNHPIIQIKPENLIRKVNVDLDAEFENAGITNPSGLNAWLLYFILTNPPREVEKMLSSGRQAITDVATEEFGQWQFKALEQLLEACLTQFSAYWTTVIEYKEKDSKSEAGKSTENPSP